MSTLRPPIFVMTIRISGLAALKMEKDEKLQITNYNTENEERSLYME